MDSRESRNLLYIKRIIVAVRNELAKFFIKKWNSFNEKKYGKWDNTTKSGKIFWKLESKRKLDKNIQKKYENGDTSKWDCTTLFDAILFSNSIGKHLDKKTKDAVHKLRGERNKDAHWYESEYSDDDFDAIVNNIEKSFQDLKFSFDEIEEIKSYRKRFNPFRVLPPKSNHFVVERTELRDQIIKDLEELRKDNNNELTYFYITGNPGSGKSQLVKQVCEKISCGWTNEASFVMTLDGKDVDSLLKSYSELGYCLNCDDIMIKNFNDENCCTKEKVKNLRSLISTRLKFWQSWLIIVDNVIQLSEISPLLPQVSDPLWRNGQIILTVQNTDAVPYDELFSKHVSISSGMNDEECIQLLKHYTKDESAGDESLKMVSHALDRQPLALAAAGFYFSRVKKTNSSFTWTQYLGEISLGQQEYMDASFVEFNSVYPKSMLHAVLLAVRQNAEESPMLAKVICFFSMISFDPIPRDIIVYYIQKRDPEQSKEDICLCLDECSLLLHSENNNEINLHRIVHKATIVYQSENENEEHEVEHGGISPSSQHAFGQIAQALYKFHEREDQIKLIPHLEKLLELFKTHSMKVDMNIFQVFEFFTLTLKKFAKYNLAFELLDKIKTEAFQCDFFDKAWYFTQLGALHHWTGEYFKSKENHEKALEIKEKKLGLNYVDLAVSLNNLGVACDKTGECVKAVEFHEKALEILKTSSGPNHVDVAASLNNLGLLSIKTGQYDKTINFHKEALDIYQESFGESHVQVAESLINLGSAYYKSGEINQAKECHKKALKIFKNTLGPNHDSVSMALNNLGMVHDKNGEFDKAIEFYEKALEMKQRLLGPNHVALAVSFNNLGAVNDEIEEYDKAITCFEKALEIQQKSLGPNHVDVAVTFSNLATTYRKLGKDNKAIEFHKKALEIRKRSLGPTHVHVGLSLKNLGALYDKSGQLNKAKDFYEKALEIQKRSLGANHVDVAESLYNLGVVYDKTGEYDKAIASYIKALDIQKRSLGSNHIEVAATFFNLALVYDKTGEYSKAIEAHQQDLEIVKKCSEPNPVSVAVTSSNLGMLYGKTGEYDKAIEYLEKALEIRKNISGPNHVNVAESLFNVGLLYDKTGLYDKAIECHKKALEIFENSFGSNQVYVTMSLNNLALLYAKTGEGDKAMELLQKAQNIFKNP
ncbi:tetratricopeptide repeat protein 28-like [Xenia sp. Carnegie-2017]|uniref:tetratricopeptide repeat protein 28-like n=1 Tax=Xenia sp. Carnegie-2017 TaxID=2897299 RepID=UPI001F034AD9|nr:tetratricopeptide repeat protein 28-like [Xenia sp. Carnegie-2017]